MVDQNLTAVDAQGSADVDPLADVARHVDQTAWTKIGASADTEASERPDVDLRVGTERGELERARRTERTDRADQVPSGSRLDRADLPGDDVDRRDGKGQPLRPRVLIHHRQVKGRVGGCGVEGHGHRPLPRRLDGFQARPADREIVDRRVRANRPGRGGARVECREEQPRFQGLDGHDAGGSAF